MRFSVRARRVISSGICIPVLVVAAACGNPVAPTDQIDTFNGTLTPPVNGVPVSAVQEFTMKSGIVTVSLINLAPLTTITVGVGIGTKSGSQCNAFDTNEASRAGNVVLTEQLPSGLYCVGIYDLGNITQNETFGITIEYPK